MSFAVDMSIAFHSDHVAALPAHAAIVLVVPMPTPTFNWTPPTQTQVSGACPGMTDEQCIEANRWNINVVVPTPA